MVKHQSRGQNEHHKIEAILSFRQSDQGKVARKDENDYLVQKECKKALSR
jgi:hypothetical protein